MIRQEVSFTYAQFCSRCSPAQIACIHFLSISDCSKIRSCCMCCPSMATPTDCNDPCIPRNGDESSPTDCASSTDQTLKVKEHTTTSILEQWYEVSNRREMTLVTIGRSGAGKSTLISNMLRLKDIDTLQSQHSSSSVTQEVEIYRSSPAREGQVTIHMVDTPDFNSSYIRDARGMALL